MLITLDVQCVLSVFMGMNKISNKKKLVDILVSYIRTQFIIRIVRVQNCTTTDYTILLKLYLHVEIIFAYILGLEM
jgi:hypothetical protein